MTLAHKPYPGNLLFVEEEGGGGGVDSLSIGNKDLPTLLYITLIGNNRLVAGLPAQRVSGFPQI